MSNLYWSEIQAPLYCAHIDDLQNGTIARTRLLQPGQTIKTLPHGVYPITGGLIHIGYLGGGSVTKVTGNIVSGNNPGLFYTPSTQPYNSNFASVLFEIHEARQATISHSALDYV